MFTLRARIALSAFAFMLVLLTVSVLGLLVAVVNTVPGTHVRDKKSPVVDPAKPPLAGAAKPASPPVKLPIVEVEGQPLAANVARLLEALTYLGAPLPKETTGKLQTAIKERNASKIQELLDPQVLFVVTLDPEARVKAAPGPAPATIQQSGFTPVLVKVANQCAAQKALRITSPQAGPVYSERLVKGDKNRFLDVEMFGNPPMTPYLSGLEVEYAIALLFSTEAGKRPATIAFGIGQGGGAEVPVVFDILPAIAVKLSIQDADGKPTTGRFTFSDKLGRIFPPKPKRLAPDLFFQDQVYRHDGGTVLLPPGEFTLSYGRGPEYQLVKKKIVIPEKGEAKINVKLERWINPMSYGFYGGDHHIHAAGCRHYCDPSQGVLPEDMFTHVKGEGLNVGCCLTWGRGFEFQQQFFAATAHKLSEPFTVIKYDVEVSGFGSQALGHLCLLNLREQTYPGSAGTVTKGWPTWTTPVLRWAKQQGAVTGYPHSATGLGVDPRAAARRLFAELDGGQKGRITRQQALGSLLPEDFDAIDIHKDGFFTEDELTASLQRVAKRLPNHAIPEMNGTGAQEIFVTVAQGLCDFISSMSTDRVQEWNCWYHILNCGFPLKVSGEDDFPCITGNRVGQGRVYVQLGKVERIDFNAWCEGLRQGRSYISDGYAHALEFAVRPGEPGAPATGVSPGYGDVIMSQPGMVTAKAKVAFASTMPLGTSAGGKAPTGKTRMVELVVNGYAVAAQEVPADDKEHEVAFTVPIDRSSWVALRTFPQMHTNPVNVLVAGKPIRASRKSALWCIGAIQQLWRMRGDGIAKREREEARQTFLQAIEKYRRIAEEAEEGS